MDKKALWVIMAQTLVVLYVLIEILKKYTKLYFDKINKLIFNRTKQIWV